MQQLLRLSFEDSPGGATGQYQPREEKNGTIPPYCAPLEVNLPWSIDVLRAQPMNSESYHHNEISGYMARPSLNLPAPPLKFHQEDMKAWGEIWRGKNPEKTGSAWKEDRVDYFVKKDAMDFANYLDSTTAECLSQFLGGIPIQFAKQNHLTPIDGRVCVELGEITICGGVRQQNFDVAFRPDGPRIIVDSKGLNATKSIQKNWQNMINDIATEATTVHLRYPYAITSFVIALPKQALRDSQRADIINTLERMAGRDLPHYPPSLSEIITLMIWDVDTGEVDPEYPHPDSPLRVEKFSEILERTYCSRYKGLLPHESVL